MFRPTVILAGKRMLLHRTAKPEPPAKNCLYFSSSKNITSKKRGNCTRIRSNKNTKISIGCTTRYYTTYNDEKLKKNEEPIPVKTMLKTFFRLVHPDFFSDHPAEKEENEKSFQALQSFLNSFQEMRPTLEVYDMHFYLRSLDEDKTSQQKQTTAPTPNEQKADEKTDKNIYTNSASKEQTEKKATEAQKPKFRQVAIKFTSPDPSSSTDAKDKYLERCLARLFTMCGMTSPITAHGYSSGVAMSDINYQATKQADPVGLVNFLNKTCTYAKQRTRERLNYERQVDFARSALYIQFKVKIVFEIPTEELPSNVITQLRNQYDLLLKLENALKTYHKADPKGMENLAKVAVVFGKSTGVDKMGRANIIYTDSEGQWIETLKKVSGETIAKIRENAKIRSEKEKQVGQLLGVAYFYSDYHVSSSDDYTEFLDQVAEQFKATKSQYKFPEVKDGLRSLKVRIVNPVDTPSIRPYSVDYYTCVIVIPMGCQPEQLFEFIDERGFETVNKYNEGLKESGLLHNHINKVKTSLRLRALTYESDIRSKDLISCLSRLTIHFSKIDLQLDGVRLHIGHQYDLRKEDGTITIKWNYALE